MTVEARYIGTGSLLFKGAEHSPVPYEITLSEITGIRRLEGWIEATVGILSQAHSSGGTQLRLSDGKIVDVSMGSFRASGATARAELIVHSGL